MSPVACIKTDRALNPLMPITIQPRIVITSYHCFFILVTFLLGDNNLCGVGINFKPDMTGALEVHSVVPGSPAAAETKIKQGDLLEQVNHSV